MFKKSLIFASFLLVSQRLWASTEDALILNQELQFLEESTTQVKIIGENETKTLSNSNESELDDSLERKYFGNEINDSINTKAAAPAKRRSF